MSLPPKHGEQLTSPQRSPPPGQLVEQIPSCPTTAPRSLCPSGPPDLLTLGCIAVELLIYPWEAFTQNVAGNVSQETQSIQMDSHVLC